MLFTITYEEDGTIVLEFGAMMTLRVPDRGVAFDREAVEAVAHAAHNHIMALVATPQSENRDEIDEFLRSRIRPQRDRQDISQMVKTALLPQSKNMNEIPQFLPPWDLDILQMLTESISPTKKEEP